MIYKNFFLVKVWYINKNKLLSKSSKDIYVVLPSTLNKKLFIYLKNTERHTKIADVFHAEHNAAST